MTGQPRPFLVFPRTMTDTVAGHLELEVLWLLNDLKQGRGHEDVVHSED